MITIPMIIIIIKITYIPATPRAGDRVSASDPPTVPPASLINSNKPHKIRKQITAAPDFQYAIRLCLFDTRNAVTPNSRKGTRYAPAPKLSIRKAEADAPSVPPNPKLLIRRSMLTASTIHIIISSITKFSPAFFVVFPVVFLDVLFFLDFEAI